MEEKKRYLEHHWVLAQKELDQEKVLRDKLHSESTHDYERALSEEKAKYAATLKEHKQQIAELKKTHQRQCDELGQEILKANLEADRLHSQLSNGGVRTTRLFSKSRGSSVPSIFFYLVPLLVAVSVS